MIRERQSNEALASIDCLNEIYKQNPLLTFLRQHRIIMICAFRCRSREFVRGGGSSGGASSVSRGGRAPSYPTRGSRSLSNRGSGRGE